MREAGVEDAAGEMLAVFLTDAPSRMTAIEGAVAGGTPESVSRAAHAYTSAAGTIRATRLAELLREMEQAGGEGRVGRIAELLPRLLEEHERVTRCVARALEKWGPVA
jgi:HPt (histidine-containing phosphotransfer) domain-containing protein